MARGLRCGGWVGVQGAVGGPEQARVAVAFALSCDPPGQVAQVPAGGGVRLGPAGLPAGFQQGGDGGPVQAAVGVRGADEVVGVAVDLGGRGQDVAAAGAEVQVVGGQVAVALVRAAEVGVQAAAGGADVRGRAVDQAGLAERGEGGVPVAGRAVLVDVQDVGSGCAGGDGQVPVRVAAEPGGNPPFVGGGVAEAVPGQRDLPAVHAGEHGPAAGCAGEGLAERLVGHGLLQGWPSAGAGLRGWPQVLVSARSWPARTGRMRA